MSKSELTLEIENQALKEFSKMGVFMCPECTFERAWIGDKPANCSIEEFNFNPIYNQVEDKHIKTEIVDILELNSQKGWVCYEIKISKADFKSKAAKSFVGNYNYYLMPEELYIQVANEIPKEIGVYSYNGKYLYLKKKARKQKLIDGMDGQLYYGMVRSLNREREKQRDKIMQLYYLQLNTYISKIHDEIREKNQELWNLKHYTIPYPEEKIKKLEIELDILDDVYMNLKNIKYKI